MGNTNTYTDGVKGELGGGLEVVVVQGGDRN